MCMTNGSPRPLRHSPTRTQRVPSGAVSSTTRVFSYDGGGQILGRTDGTVSGTGSSATFTALAGADVPP